MVGLRAMGSLQRERRIERLFSVKNERKRLFSLSGHEKVRRKESKVSVRPDNNCFI